MNMLDLVALTASGWMPGSVVRLMSDGVRSADLAGFSRANRAGWFWHDLDGNADSPSAVYTL